LPKNSNRTLCQKLCFFKKLDDEQSIKQEDFAINFSHVLFILLDFLTLEDGTDRLPQNVIKELLLYAA